MKILPESKHSLANLQRFGRTVSQIKCCSLEKQRDNWRAAAVGSSCDTCFNQNEIEHTFFCKENVFIIHPNKVPSNLLFHENYCANFSSSSSPSASSSLLPGPSTVVHQSESCVAHMQCPILAFQLSYSHVMTNNWFHPKYEGNGRRETRGFHNLGE